MTRRMPVIGMVNSLIRLKIATFLNAGDHDWDRTKDRKIIYFADADILGLFLETPTEKRDRGAPDNHGRSRLLGLFEEDDETPIYIPAEYETAEYIFSAHLPAQQSKMLYFSDLHLHEVESMRTAIMLREPDPFVATALADDEEDDATAQLRSFSDEIVAKADEGYTDEEIKLLCKRAATLTITLFEPKHETQDPRIYRSAQTILALERARRRWQSARVIPRYGQISDGRSSRAVLDWCARIASEREGSGYISQKHGIDIYNRSRSRDRDSILSDACTLADVIELNRQLPPNQKAVLLSGTHAVHRAYARWFLDRQPGYLQERYHLRHPVQFLPLINLGSYSDVFGLNINQDGTARLFTDIISSLDSFLDPLRSRPDFLDVLRKFLALDHGHGSDIVPDSAKLDSELKWFDPKALQELIVGWRLAYGNSILIGLPTIERRRKEHDEILKEAIRRAGGDLLAAQNNIVANLEIDHISSALSALAAKVRQEREGVGGKKAHPNSVRGVVLPLINLRPELDACLKRAYEGPLDKAIREVRAMSSGAASVSPKIEDIVASIILIMSLGAWTQAKRLANGRLAAEGAGVVRISTAEAAGDPAIEELRYLYALAVRFECSNIKEYQRAYRFLSARRNGEEPLDAIRRGRALLERGTLQLAAALHLLAKARLGTAETWPEFSDDAELGEIRDLLRGGAIDLRRAFEGLQAANLSADSSLSDRRDRLALQAAGNSLSGWVLRRLSDSPPLTQDKGFICAAEELVKPFYEAEKELRTISLLNFEAFLKLSGEAPSFPGPKGKALIDICASVSTDDPFYRRVLAPSDIDLVRLYQALIK